MNKPKIISITLVNSPSFTQYCHACGQVIGSGGRYARIMIDLGLGDLPMSISVHQGCVNIEEFNDSVD